MNHVEQTIVKRTLNTWRNSGKPENSVETSHQQTVP